MYIHEIYKHCYDAEMSRSRNKTYAAKFALCRTEVMYEFAQSHLDRNIGGVLPDVINDINKYGLERCLKELQDTYA